MRLHTSTHKINTTQTNAMKSVTTGVIGVGGEALQ